MKAFKKLVSISAAFAMLMGGCRGNMPEEIPSENLHSVSTEDSDIVASGECGAEGDNLTWTFDDNGTLTISGKGAIMDYEYDSASPWHNYRYDILNIKIENGVTSIGERAFCTCSSLTSITIPDSVTSIGGWAFIRTPWLKAKQEENPLVIANDIVVDGRNCTGKVVIPDGVTSISDSAFYDCTKLTEITIPNGVTNIGDYVFYSCDSLTSITIPDSVTSIGSSAFESCSSLTSITIPDSVTSIGSHAFDDCSSLTSITIPDSVTSIESDAFNNCSSLTAIDVDTNNEYYASEDGVLFNKNKTELIRYPIKKDNQKYMIPDSVTSIGSDAFNDCSSLTSITIPDSVTSIGSGAFWSCTRLTTITIPDSVTSIGLLAFYDCTKLTEITIPNGVTNIGDYVFYSCDSLTSITIPDSVTSIGAFAFDECSSLTSITLNNPNCEIYNSPFTIHSSATIYGYEGSTAQAYAEKYDREFISLG